MDDILYQAAKFYADNLEGRKYLLIARKKGKEINLNINFGAEHFKHLAGLHKLKDLPISKRDSANIYREILDEKTTITDIQKSKFFSEAEKRLLNFTKVKDALYSPDLMLKSLKGYFLGITADYLLSKKDAVEDTAVSYAHLFLRDDEDIVIPVTFFTRNDDKYLRNNVRWTVHSIEEVKRQESSNTENIKPLNVKKNEKSGDAVEGQFLNYNSVRLIGALTAAPRMQSKEGNVTSQYNIEVDTNGRKDIFPIISYGQQAQKDAKCLQKGNFVMVDGNVRTGQRLQNGVQIPTFIINASSVKYLMPKPSAKLSAGAASQAQNTDEQF